MEKTRTRTSWSRIGAAAAVTICAAMSWSAVTLSAQAAPDSAAPPAVAAPQEDRRIDGLRAEVITALQRDLGLTELQARARVDQQVKAIEIDGQVRGKLGSRFGGTWFDPQAGQLVVGVTSEADAAEVTELGAKPKVVARSYAELEAIVADLDRLAGRAPGKTGTRAAGGKPAAAVGGVAGWHVDPQTNSVVVSVLRDTLSGQAQENLAKYGDAVRTENLPAAPTSTANYIDGGDQIIGGSCSAGFNLRNPSTGRRYLLTAGHCVRLNQTVTGQGGVTFGRVVARSFPASDDALIEATNSAYWIQGPWVDTNPSNGGFITITGYTDAPVGTYLCKSGVKTRLTCGNITGKNETVTFDRVNTVYGLTRHSACAERGDSGGANYVPGTQNRAEGVTSGGVLYGTGLRCGSAVGQPTISWYFPIANSIAAHGVSLW